PPLPVEHPWVPRPRRVPDGPAVQLRGRLLGGAELVVETGQVGGPGQLAIAEADVEVELVRAADLLAEEPAQGAAVDPADDLAEQVAVEQRRPAPRGTGSPGRLLSGQQRAHQLPVVERLLRRSLVEDDDARAVGQDLTDRGRRLQ